MNESLHEYVLGRLQASKGRWPRVAAGSGISIRTLEKIARREVADPGVSLVQRLADYFREQEATVTDGR